MPDTTNKQISDLLSSLAPSGEGKPLPSSNKGKMHNPLNPPVDRQAEEAAAAQPPIPTEPAPPVEPQDPNPDPAQPPQPALDPNVAAMMQQMQALQQQVISMQQQAQAASAPTEPQKVEIPQLDPGSILTQEEFQGVVKEDGTIDASKMYAALGIVAQRSYQMAREHTLQDLPSIIQQTARREAAITTTVNSFWSKNSDLRQYKAEIGRKAEEIAAADPNLPLDTVLEKAGTAVRESLNAYIQAQGYVAGNGQKANPAANGAFVPNLGGGSNGRPNGQDNRSETERGIDAMLKIA